MLAFQGERLLSKLRQLIMLLYVLSVLLISNTLISEHELIKGFYLVFPVAMLMALLSKTMKRKQIAAQISFAVLFIGGLFEPLEFDVIEETFILLPLCYIFLFPGSFWPLAGSVALLLSCYIDLPLERMGDFSWDAIKLCLITLFASVMSYFQQKLTLQAALYKRASLTDCLTDVSNRKAFFSDLRKIGLKRGYDYVSIQIGLNDLKNVNENFGHNNGDKLLKKFVSQLNMIIIDQGHLYRLTETEFIVLVSDTTNVVAKAQRLVRKITRLNNGMYRVSNTSLMLNFSLGVAVLSDAAYNTTLWGKNADIALCKARSTGCATAQWYDDSLLNETIRQNQIEIELEQAIAANQFVLVYQPKVSIKNDQIVGAEALIRWPHPQLGVISPREFIGIAEKTAQIIPIGRWVINEACKQAKLWYSQGHHICVAVNVSSVQFAHDDVYSYVREALERYHLPANLLQIEITETTLMKRPERVSDACKKLRELGVSIAIDDFGVAYSSLNYLKHLPVDVLKIDKTFIDDCVELLTDKMLVRTIIQMGRNLSKTVIAEGVETQAQLDVVKQEGCDEFQGYLFSKPISALQFTSLLPEPKREPQRQNARQTEIKTESESVIDAVTYPKEVYPDFVH
ncbi:GGDEF domain-containing protein [Vibrio sinensis]|uniref:GGDEF domain-containing protein n=1 Tax=Vibrio sinensis TaxID=2302434 RepID=A0A3A6QS84_9VIBR|nr:bifunctional diguanylate cyclase/phosphodiesterase [Vibrio sinensis]RJX75243.1 GGDEF domain-containing protein [Vibrio sinensis]